jgi:transposase/transcription antitermination factor NusG
MAAYKLFDQGISNSEIARRLSVCNQTVSRWRKQATEGGIDALKAVGRLGRKPRLDEKQRNVLIELLPGRRQAPGDKTLWSCRNFAEAIKLRFGVQYHPGHAWKLLQNLKSYRHESGLPPTQQDPAVSFGIQHSQPTTVGVTHFVDEVQPCPWFAVVTRPQYEKVVHLVLRSKGFESFLPMYLKRSRSGAKDVATPLFPQYIFCRMNPRHGKLPVLRTPGVLRILGFGRKDYIADQEIEMIKIILSIGSVRISKRAPEAGSSVRVISGSLAGVEGKFLKTKSGGRLVIWMELLHRTLTVELDEAAVEFINPR